MAGWFGKSEKKLKEAEAAVNKYRQRNPKGDLPRALQRDLQNARQDHREATDNRDQGAKARKSSKTKAMHDKLDGKPKKKR